MGALVAHHQNWLSREPRLSHTHSGSSGLPPDPACMYVVGCCSLPQLSLPAPALGPCIHHWELWPGRGVLRVPFQACYQPRMLCELSGPSGQPVMADQSWPLLVGTTACSRLSFWFPSCEAPCLSSLTYECCGAVCGRPQKWGMTSSPVRHAFSGPQLPSPGSLQHGVRDGPGLVLNTFHVVALHGDGWVPHIS